MSGSLAPDALDEADPFAGIDPHMQGPAPESTEDPFSDVPALGTSTSTIGAFGAHAARGVAPAVGGMVAAGAGAEAGAEIGAGVGALGGPLGAGVGAAVGGFVGGVGGFFAGSYATEGVQDYAIHELPMEMQEPLGISDRAQRAQEQEHPYASFLGGLVPYALTMYPGAPTLAAGKLPEGATTFQRIMANPATSRVFGGAAMGGMELGQEEWKGETPNWARIGISTGFGLLFNKPTSFGEHLTSFGEQTARSAMTPVRGAMVGAAMRANVGEVPEPPPPTAAPTEPDQAYRTVTHYPLLDIPPEGILRPDEPTVAMAADLGVVGQGVTENTFRGGEAVSPNARANATNAAADEQSLLGPRPTPDADEVARRLDPDAFTERDRLLGIQDTLRDWVNEQSAPGEDTFADLDARRYAAEEALRNANPNSPAARNFRATLTDLAAERAEMIRRSAAAASGEAVSGPDILLARQHLGAIDRQLLDLGPRLAAARRRAADFVGQPEEPVAEPEAAEEQPAVPAYSPGVAQTIPAQEVTPSATVPPEVGRSVDDQRANIIAAETARLTAAGMTQQEAETNAQVIAAHYVTRAARFGGKIGTAESLYTERAPEVRREAEPATAPEPEPALAQQAQGKVRVAPGNVRSVVTLMRDANASTFMHETAHDWLKQFMGDAAHPEAPDDLKADATTLRSWLGRDEGWTGFLANGRPDKRPQEKFARTWEQYLREGVAPSQSLARVFGRFKDWLSAIYDAAKKVPGSQINEAVRGVFDRMLEGEPKRTTYAGDKEPPLSLAAIHRTDAAETEPHQAEAVGDRVMSEMAGQAAAPPPEIASEIAKVEAETAVQPKPGGPEPAAGAAEPGAEAGARPTEPGAVGQVVGQPGPVAPGSGVGERAGGVGAVRGEAVSEGAGVSGRAGESAGQRRGPEFAGATGPEQLAPTPTDTFTGGATDVVDLAGNIRVENLTPENFRQAIFDSAERNDEFNSVRPGLTKGQMLDLAEAYGLDASQVDEAKLAQLFGGMDGLAPKVLALRRAVVQSSEVVWKAMDAATQAGAGDEEVAALAIAVSRHDMLQGALAGATHNWGQTGSAFHSLVDGWGRAEDLNQLLKSTTGRDLFQLKMLAKLGKNMDTPGKISKWLRDAQERSYGRMILEYWINGLISGIATHVTYGISNELLAIEKAGPETAAAWAIGAVRQAFGRAGSRVQIGEVGAQFGASFRELPAAVQSALEAYRSGATTLLPGETARPWTAFQGETSPTFSRNMTNDPVGWKEVVGNAYSLVAGIRDGLRSVGDLVKTGGDPTAPLFSPVYGHGQIPNFAIRGTTVLPLGDLARLPSRNVAAIHSGFRAMNYSMEINALAYRQAVEEGLQGSARDARIAFLRQNPTQEMMDGAVGKSTELTLMGQGSKWVEALSQFINKPVNVPFLGETPILKFVDPFVHIAANIMNQAFIQRTPIGLISGEVRADLMGRNGNIAQDTSAARMLMGSAYAMTAGALAAQGLISGSGPVDPHQAAMWRLAGNQAHSVRIGDVWYDVHRMGTLGMLLGVSADLYETAHALGREDASVVGMSLMHAFGQNILDESFMRGPSDLIKALTESDRYGASYVRTFLSSFVPYSVGLAQMARASDPYTRQARTIMDTIRAHVPGLSESLLPRRDVWGQPMPNNDALLVPGLTAIYERRMTNDPVNMAMLNLGIAPAPVERMIRNVKLTDQQYDDFARVAGVTTKSRLDAIVRGQDFATWPRATQHDVIQEVIRQSRESARGWMMMKNPEIPREAAQMRGARREGKPIE